MTTWYTQEQVAAADQQWRLQQAAEQRRVAYSTIKRQTHTRPATGLAALVSYLGFVRG